MTGAYTILGVGRPELGWLLNHVVFDAIYFLAAISCAIYARSGRPRARAWWFLAGSMAATGIASVLFSVQGSVWWAMDVSDAFRLLAYPLIGLTVLMLVHGVRNAISRRFIVDSAALAVGLLTTLFLLLGVGNANPPGSRALVFATCAMVLAAIGIAALLEAIRYPQLLALTVGLLISVVADAVFSLQLHNGSYEAGRPLDQLWQLTVLVFSLAPWVGGSVEPTSSGVGKIGGPIAVVAVAAALATLALTTAQTEVARLIAGVVVVVCVAVALLRIARHVRQMTSYFATTSLTTETMLHDLRQPLTAARAAVTQMIPRVDANDAAVLLEVDHNLVAAAHATVLGRHEPAAERSPTPIAEIVASAVTDLQLGNGVVQVSIPPDVLVAGDRAVLEAVVRNVVANAIEHGAPPVRLSAIAGEPVALIVEDAGAGVSLQPVETAFGRGVSRHRDLQRGNGLTLARALARASGGDVRYEPTPSCPGRFVIDLPARPRG